MKNLTLIEPTVALKAEFYDMAEEWRASGHDKFQESFGDFNAYLERLAKQKESKELPPGWVPNSTFWLVTHKGHIVGTSRLRHWLVPDLEKEGGHIGYDIRPSERRKGYGTKLLTLMLVQAKAFGLEEVLVTCDNDNIGSISIIEKNGGQLIGHTVSDQSGKEINRYRINL